MYSHATNDYLINQLVVGSITCQGGQRCSVYCHKGGKKPEHTDI